MEIRIPMTSIALISELTVISLYSFILIEWKVVWERKGVVSVRQPTSNDVICILYLFGRKVYLYADNEVHILDWTITLNDKNYSNYCWFLWEEAVNLRLVVLLLHKDRTTKRREVNDYIPLILSSILSKKELLTISTIFQVMCTFATDASKALILFRPNYSIFKK